MRSREPAGLPQSSPIAASSLLLLALAGCGGEGSGFQLPPTTGTLQVTTTTAGDEPDPDGYTFQLDGEAPQPIGAAATTALSELEPGDHTMRLDGLAPNCSVAENPRSVRIDAGQTTTSTFAVACSATSGGVVITTVTTGDTPDPDGFGVVLDGVDQGPIPVNGQLSLTGVALGSHVVGLSGLAGNCSLQGDNLRAVTVTPGSSAPVDYAITCTAPPANAGTLRVITATTGDSPDPDGYSFSLDRGENQPIGANATATITNLAAGAHRVQLAGLSDECRVQGNSARTVNVPGGGTNDVTFNVSCQRAVGSIRVTVFTSGSPADPDGYQVLLDNATPGQLVEPDGSVRFSDVPVGSHAVTLDGIATNCSVTEGPSRSVAVTSGGVAEVSFRVSCSGTSGSIAVTTQTTGESVDADGYTIVVDGSNRGTIGSSAQQTVTEVSTGSHQIELNGVAVNCQVQGSSTQTVTVTANTTATVSFSVSCSASTGSIKVSVATSGGQPDEDGYVVALDGSPQGNVGANGDATLGGVPMGNHTVALRDVAANCSVTGGASQEVSVSEGATSEVSFAVDCPAPPPEEGSIRVSTSTTGEDQDDGYSFSVDGGASQNIGPNESLTVDGLTPGEHSVELSGLAQNCSLQQQNPQQISVQAGQAADADFDIACTGQAVNRSPNAANDSYSMTKGSTFRADAPSLLANDTDEDGDPLSTKQEEKATSEQGNVVIGNDGSFDYTPPSETYTGLDTFEYTATDGRGGESTAVASITIEEP